jgi:hypothetical protein
MESNLKTLNGGNIKKHEFIGWNSYKQCIVKR